MSARFEPIVGRYMHLDLFGMPHRLYVEEAGQGTPLLCLHTAGSDGRQYRALMNEKRITSRYRVIAFDMPWHGKSSPPARWHNEEYQLTSAQYTTMVLSVMTALELDRPVLIGCSIGGRIALHLALEHPQAFRAIIGLQAGAHIDPYYDLSFLHRPDIHGGEVCAAIVSGLVGPDAPEKERWETLWHYMQGGPGVFKAISISTRSTAISAAASPTSTPDAVRCFCCQASTIIPAPPRRRWVSQDAFPAARPPS